MNPVVLGVFLVSSLSMVGVFSLVPALSAIAEGLQIDANQAGYLIAVFTFGNISAAPFIGLWLDKRGRRFVLLPSLVLFGVAGIACGLVDSFTWVLIFRFLQGLGGAALGVVAVTILSDLFQGPDRIRFFGYNMAVTSVGLMLFPVLGGLLSGISWRIPFYLSGVSLPVALYCWLFLKYAEPKNLAADASYFGQLWRSVKDPLVVRLSVINLGLFAVFTGSFLSFFAHMIDQQWLGRVILFGDLSSYALSVENFSGVAVMLFSLAMGLASFRLGWLHHRFGFQTIFAAGLLLYGLSLLVMGVVASPLTLLAMAVILGFSHGLVVPSMIGLYTKLAPKNMTGSYVVLNGLVFRFGQMVGPILAGVVYLALSVEAVFIGAALIMLPLLVLAMRVDWRARLAS